MVRILKKKILLWELEVPDMLQSCQSLLNKSVKLVHSVQTVVLFSRSCPREYPSLHFKQSVSLHFWQPLVTQYFQALVSITGILKIEYHISKCIFKKAKNIVPSSKLFRHIHPEFNQFKSQGK